MRTTLDIDDDVLHAAKEIARAENKTTGKVMSELVRKRLTEGLADNAQAEYRGGFKMLPRSAEVVTPELIERLVDDG